MRQRFETEMGAAMRPPAPQKLCAVFPYDQSWWETDVSVRSTGYFVEFASGSLSDFLDLLLLASVTSLAT